MEFHEQDKPEDTRKEDVQPSQQEEIQYDDGADHASAESKSYLISYFACEKISWVSQSIVFLVAIWHIIQMILFFQEKYTPDFNLESKETMVTDDPWFNFAICVRPLMSPSVLSNFFKDKNIDFTALLKAAHMDHKSLSFDKDTTLDYYMFPDEFEEYFKYIHPWDKLPGADDLYEYRENDIKNLFSEIKVNHDNINISEKGEFSLSPVYGGCLNLTVSEPMSKHPMEITLKIKSRSSSNSLKGEQDSGLHYTEYADFFLYGQNDTFTEIEPIKKQEAYTFSLKNYHRVSIKGSNRTRKGDCKNEQDYSKTNCLYWCKMRPFLNSVPCSLPWMREIVKKHPEVARSRQPCRHAKDFFGVLKRQDEFLKDKATKDCNCPDKCSTWDISMYSLGVDHNSDLQGMYFVVSPEITTVKQHDDEKLLPIVGEMCAALSFLFGLTFIMVYDWLVTILLWLFGLFTNVHDSWSWPWEYEAWDQYEDGDYGADYYDYDDYDYDEDLSSYDMLDDEGESFIWHKEPESQLIHSNPDSKTGMSIHGIPEEDPRVSESNVSAHGTPEEEPRVSESNASAHDTPEEQPAVPDSNVSVHGTTEEQPLAPDSNVSAHGAPEEQPRVSESNVSVHSTPAE